ncbi:hypothetical protein P0Y31_11220 [Knoellia sp. 3-2P3]|uniref:hypothetical protein n=1 Tax=unclassified Knoellia TaxID=2618719 RepID=UPI0023DBBCF0|nr:hypothetical protein [Knoellia sp. 3-2P3]MDF2092916.1 hypothetical protein [Knoellia sp. 3-2P3]
MGRPGAMSEAQFRMVAVRLLEVAAVLLLVLAVFEVRESYLMAGQEPDPTTMQTRPDAFSWGRLAMAVGYSVFRAPLSLMVAGGLLVGATAVLADRRPVVSAAVLRWEVAAVGAVAVLLTLCHLVAGAAWAWTMAPEGVSDFDTPLQRSSALAWPLVALVLQALFVLWWLRLGDGAPVVATDAAPVREAASDPEAVETLAPAEPTEHVEWIAPDGATTNGYDDYFRRR